MFLFVILFFQDERINLFSIWTLIYLQVMDINEINSPKL